MYKHASRNLQRAHGIGSIAAASQPGDALPDPDQMTLEQAEAERGHLRAELAALENALLVAKRDSDKGQVQSLGYRKASLQARASALNNRIRALLREDPESPASNDDRWRAAIDAVCPEHRDAIEQYRTKLWKEGQ